MSSPRFTRNDIEQLKKLLDDADGAPFFDRDEMNTLRKVVAVFDDNAEEINDALALVRGLKYFGRGGHFIVKFLAWFFGLVVTISAGWQALTWLWVRK